MKQENGMLRKIFADLSFDTVRGRRKQTVNYAHLELILIRRGLNPESNMTKKHRDKKINKGLTLNVQSN